MAPAQARTVRTMTAAASGVPSPRLRGSTARRIAPSSSSMTMVSTYLSSTSANAIGRSLRSGGSRS
eukprot:9042697-Heterocapsa_arctica.AAC.1